MDANVFQQNFLFCILADRKVQHMNWDESKDAPESMLWNFLQWDIGGVVNLLGEFEVMY